MKIYFFLTTILFFSFEGFSQVVTQDENTINSSLIQLAEEMPEKGSYKILLKGEKTSREIPDEIMYQVNSKRLYDEVVFIEINKNVRIKILPFREIRDKNFTPIKTYVYEK